MYGDWASPWGYFAGALFGVAAFVAVCLILAPYVQRAIEHDDDPRAES